MLTMLFAPPALIAALLCAGRLYRSFTFGAGLLVFVYILGAITITPLAFRVAGFHIYLEDVAGIGLASTAMLRLLRAPRLRRRTRAWYGFIAATAFAFALGAAAYGLKAAGVEYRNFFYFCSAILYCASFPIDAAQLKSLARIWMVGAGALLALALFRWAADAVHLGFASQWAAVGGGQRLRVLNASHTFFLAQALMIAVFFRPRMPQLTPFVTVLGAAVILLQHRSVWVALLLSAAAICWRQGIMRRFVKRIAITAAIGVTIFFVAPQVFNRDTLLADSLAASIEEPFDPDHSTFGWRVGLWQAYLFEFLTASGAQQITGIGFGNPTIYAVDVSESANSAHNYYIFALNRTGILGLATLLAAYLSMLGRFRIRIRGWNYYGLFFGLIVSQIVYYTVYSPSPDQGLIAGAALGFGAAIRHGRPTSEHPEAPARHAIAAA